MKILLITAYYKEEARAIPTSYKLANLLADKGHKVIVLTSKAISKRTYEHHKNIKVVETKDFFLKDPLNINFMPFIFGALSKVLKREKPDACIISKYIFFPIITAPYLKLKHQSVVVLTDTYPGIAWFTRSKLVNFLTWVYYHTVGRLFLNMADLVVLTHEEIIEATKRLGIKSFRVIHNGIDLEKVGKARPAADIKKRQGEVIITFVGRLASIKGLDTLMEAAKNIVGRHRNVRFLVVGDGNQGNLFKHRKIECLGYREDVLSILKRSDVFVMPSISEGLPAAVIEAMACGLPVVGSDIPGGMRTLVKNNETGLSFKKGSAKDLEKKLEMLIGDKHLRQKLGRNAMAHIQRNFNNEKIAGEWEQALEGLKKGERKK